MCRGNGEGLRRIPGPTRQPGWGSPGWPPSRRSLVRLFRLAEHEPTCRWRRSVEAVRRGVRIAWAGWST